MIMRSFTAILVLLVLIVATPLSYAQTSEIVDVKITPISKLEYYLYKLRAFAVQDAGTFYCDQSNGKITLNFPLHIDCGKCGTSQAKIEGAKYFRGVLQYSWNIEECSSSLCDSSKLVTMTIDVDALCRSYKSYFDTYGEPLEIEYKAIAYACGLTTVCEIDSSTSVIKLRKASTAPPEEEEQPPEEEEEEQPTPPAKCEPKIISASVDKSYAKEGDIVTITAVVQNTGSATCSKILVEGSLLPCEEDPAGCSYRQTIMAIEAPPGSLCCPGNENYADAYIYNLAPNAKETVHLKVKAPAKGTYDACNPDRHFGTDHYWYAKVGIYQDCGKPAYDYRKVGIVRKVVPEESGSNEGQTDTGEKVTTCSSDADCPQGYVCSQGQCVESGKECVTSDDCERWEVCEEGKCVVPKELYLLLAILLIGSFASRKRQPVVVVGK